MEIWHVVVIGAGGLVLLGVLCWHSEATAPRGRTPDEITAIWFGRETKASMRDIGDVRELQRENLEFIAEARKQARERS